MLQGWGKDSVQDSLEIALDEISLGPRRIRFIDWTSFGNHNLVSKTKETRIPLFLGADVLSECSVAVANQPRTHAKFAKKGFATKVYFPPSVRIVDVHGTGRGLWFYSIQGLFRIAFELYTRFEQLECMIRLSKVWRDSFSDPLLKADIYVVPGQQDLETALGLETCLVQTETSAESPPSKTCISLPKPGTPVSQRRQNITQFLRIPPAENQPSQGNQSYPAPGINHGYFGEVMLELVQACQDREENNPCEEERQNVLLVMSQWLGREFYKCRDKIENKATLFKERHITSIDNLPPAQQVIEELFPVCMRIFLSAWMGADVDGGNQASQTRKYAEPSSLLPCIQLILELTNQILVSGVAHILYSRLHKSDHV